MDAIKLNLSGTKLVNAVETGSTADLKRKTIPADLIRRIVLGLPLNGDRSIWSEVGRLLGRPSAPCGCVRTAVGVSIKNAIIKGTLDLSSATGEEGGPMCPLAFEDCTFQDRFVGAHARFSRLSFIGCTFVDSGTAGDRPTIDLSGAAIDSDLQMRRIRPLDAPDDRDSPWEHKTNYLWIRLRGARIDGEVDLCDSRLRARAPDPANSLDMTPNDVLDLSLAEVKGDIQFRHATSEGRVMIRMAHIAGDVWMTGASVENTEKDWLRGQALLIQGSRIEGFLMLTGGRSKLDGRFHPFACEGELKLEAAEIGRSIYIQDAIIGGPIKALHLSVRDDLYLHGEMRGSVDLTGCRIGGSLHASRLNLATSVGEVKLKDGSIGRTFHLAPPHGIYEFIAAREAKLEACGPLRLVETLWRSVGSESGSEAEQVPLRYKLVQAAFLIARSSPIWSRIYHLDGHADPIRCAAEEIPGYKAGDPLPPVLETIAERYVLGPRQPSPDAQFRLENSFILHSQVPDLEAKTSADPPQWVTPETVGNMIERQPRKKMKVRLARHIQSRPLLQASFDLEGLSCDMLDDDGGRAWGTHSNRINMNHFVYRRSSWGEGGEAHPRALLPARIWGMIQRWAAWLRGVDPDDEQAEAGGAGAVRTARNWANSPAARGYKSDRVITLVRKSSFRWLLDHLKGAMADWLWIGRWLWIAKRLRRETDYLHSWQIRRNWIYRQFTPLPEKLRGLVSLYRYRIDEDKYRTQPLEQATLVARAEGREDVAIRFEMLKRRIEWRLFNDHSRWPLAGTALLVAAGWLVVHGGSFGWTFAALLATWVMMAYVSYIDDVLKKFLPWMPARRVLQEIILYIPAAVLLVTSEWLSEPLYFIEAFLIYLSIRFVSFFVGHFMRLGFGYLRRPVRAVVTLLAAFFIGWFGVHTANFHDMLVVASVPAAQVAAPEHRLNYPYKEPDMPHEEPVPLLVGTRKIEGGGTFVGEISCAPTMSEPLYALDILIPLVDLHEESRCEIRRVPRGEAELSGKVTKRKLGQAEQPPATVPAKVAPEPVALPRKRPSKMRFDELWAALPELIVHDHRVWWWMKALYAIAGWFIVSLALLTFAQVNRTHGEGAESG